MSALEKYTQPLEDSRRAQAERIGALNQRVQERVDEWARRFGDQTALSAEYESLLKERACPACGTPSGLLNSNIEWLRDGQPVRKLGFAGRRAFFNASSLVSSAPPDSSSFSRLSMRCKSCRTEWPLFRQGALYGEWQTGEIHETVRSEDFIGEDAIEISNASSTELVRTLRVGKEWTSAYTLEEAATAEASKSFGFLKLKATVSQTIEEKYSITAGEKRTVEEELSITVPPQTSVKVLLRWKRIWQHGYVEALAADKSVHQVPFKVALASTFDQSQVEL